MTTAQKSHIINTIAQGNGLLAAKINYDDHVFTQELDHLILHLQHLRAATNQVVIDPFQVDDDEL